MERASLPVTVVVDIGYGKGHVRNTRCGDGEGYNERVLIVLPFCSVN